MSDYIIGKDCYKKTKKKQEQKQEENKTAKRNHSD